MRCQRDEDPSNDPRPQSVGLAPIVRKIQHLKLPEGGHHLLDAVPASRNFVENLIKRQSRSSQIKNHLDDVRPNHSRHSALEGIVNGENSHQDNGRDHPHMGRYRQDQACGIEPHPIRQSACDQKNSRREILGLTPESLPEKLVGSEEFLTKVRRNQKKANNDSPDQVAERELQEGKV